MNGSNESWCDFTKSVNINLWKNNSGDFEREQQTPFSNALSEYQIVPNPSNDFWRVSFRSERLPEKIRITDITGKVILEENVSEDKINIRCSNYAKGIYLATLVYRDGSTKTSKLIRN